MAMPLYFPRFRALDANGNPLASGKVYTYIAGTSTPLATYSNSTLTSANTNPVILDANGEATIFGSTTENYKVVLKTSADVTQWTVDGISLGASDVTTGSNLIINGGFQIWQRGTSFAGTTGYIYGPDRWSLWRASAATGMTVSRQTGSAPSRYCVRVQRDSGNSSVTEINFAQAFTTNNTYALRGKYHGARFRARCGSNYSAASSLLKVRVITGTGTDEHPSDPYTGAATLLDTSVTLTTNWEYFEVNAGAIGDSITESCIVFVYVPVGTASTNDYFELQEVQAIAIDSETLEFNEYPWRSFEDDLAACLPYYEKSFPYATAPAQNAGVTGAWYFMQIVGATTGTWTPTETPFSVRKRATPTVTLYNPSAANAQARNIAQTNDWSACAAGGLSANGFMMDGTTSSGSALGNVSAVHWTADAEL